jgi:hypothetical protein
MTFVWIPDAALALGALAEPGSAPAELGEHEGPPMGELNSPSNGIP